MFFFELHGIEQNHLDSTFARNNSSQYLQCRHSAKQALPVIFTSSASRLVSRINLNPHSREQHRAASFFRCLRLNSFRHTVHVRVFALVIFRLDSVMGATHANEILVVVRSASSQRDEVIH